MRIDVLRKKEKHYRVFKMLTRYLFFCLCITTLCVRYSYTRINQEIIHPRVKRETVAGFITTWNMGNLALKTGRENTDILISTACEIIANSDVIALQEATHFDYEAYCHKGDYYYIGDGEFQILAKKEKFLSLSKRSYDSMNKQYYAGQLTPADGKANLILVNVHFWDGAYMETQRQSTLNQIRSSLHFLTNEVVFILGDFNTVTPSDKRGLKTFALQGKIEPFSYIHEFDGHDVYTTTTGRFYDGILTNKKLKPRETDIDNFPFEAREPARFPGKPEESLFMLRLVNNWNVLRFMKGKHAIADKLEQCTARFVRDRSKVNCPQSWISSSEVSNNLPLQLEITLPKGRQLKIGTWNVNGVNIEARLRDLSIRKQFRKIVPSFDLLALQEIPRSGDGLKILQKDFNVGYFVETSKLFSHALYLSRKLRSTRKSIKYETVPLKPLYQHPAGFYMIKVEDGADDIIICVASVHLKSDTQWTDVISAIKQLQDIEDRSSCHLFVAMGTFNSKRGSVSDMTAWQVEPAHAEFFDQIIPCEDSKGFRYTRPVSRHRFDYIFMIENDGTIGTLSCKVLKTGTETVAIGDWREVSDHYPIGAWM